MSKKNTLRAILLLFLFTLCAKFGYSQVNIPPDGNFHLEHPDIYFSDDVPTFTNKVFYALPNGFGPTANFPTLGVRNQGDGSRYSEREAWYNTSQGGYYPNAFPFIPQYTDEATAITVSQLVSYRGRRPNSSTYVMYTNYTYKTFVIRTEVPEFVNTVAIKNICNSQTPITISDFFKSTVTGVVFKIDGNIATEIIPSALSLGAHTLTATKSYDNGLFETNFSFNILEKPNAIITANGNTDICDGSSLKLSAPTSPTGITYTYLWSTGETSREINVVNAGAYSVTVSNDACSSVSPSLSVTTKPIPDKTVNVTGVTDICDGTQTILTLANAASYMWYKDNVFLGITTQSLVVTTAGSYRGQLTGANGCTNMTDPIVITVKPNPKPLIQNTGSLQFCDGGSVTLTAQVPSGIPTSYTWSDGQTGQTIIVKTAGIYTVRVDNPGGCQAVSDPISVTVLSNPKATVTAIGNTSICTGDAVRLVASPGASYLWNTGETTKEILASAAGNYTVTVKNPNGCESLSDVTTITVKQRPAANISSNRSTVLCAGETVTLTASAGDSYLWNTGETSQSINVSQAGVYLVEVSTNGCTTQSAPKTVYVNTPATPTITPSGTLNPCFGQPTTLTASDGASFLWSTGETSKSITVYTTGTYIVTVKDINGCSATSQSVTVTYKPEYTPTISASGALTFCAGGQVTLTASTGASYLWSNGATTQNIIVTTPGVFTCRVTNAQGCSNETSPITVVVQPIPKPTFALSQPSPLCEGQSTTAYITNPETGAVYTWSNGASGTSATYTTSGNITVYVTYQNGCSTVSDPTNLVVKALPKPTISASNDSQICDGSTLTLTINETAASYRWSTGATTKSIVVSTAGSYIGYVNNNDGCERASDPLLVSVKNNRIAAISIFGKTFMCEGETTILTASSGASYQWSTGETTKSISVTTTGVYSVEITNASGCVSTSEDVRVTVNPIPKPVISAASSTDLCQGETVLLTCNQFGTSYRWSNGETTKSILVNSAGTYVVYITNPQGCERASEPIIVNVKANPKPVIYTSGLTTFCEGESVTLSVPMITGYTYNWSNGVSGNVNTITTTGNYFVTVTNAVGCTNVSDAVRVTVNAIPKPTIQVVGSTDFCEPQTVTLTIRETAAGYRWSTGETTKSITLSASNTVTAFLINAQGCERESDPITVTVKANPLPVIVAASSTSFCEGQSVRLSVPNVPGYQYQWSNGATTPTITVNEGGDYFVKVTNLAGCERISEITKVTVFAIPKPTIQVVGSTDFCEPETVTLTIRETGASYRWSNGATTKSITLSASATVTAFIKNAEGCERESDPISIIVKKNPLPVIISSASTTFCEGENIKLSVPNVAGYQYEWSTGATTSAITVTESGDYFVKVVNAAGCERVSEVTKVTVHPISKPTIQVVGSTSFCEPETVTLTINETAFSYRWSNGATTKSITLSASETVTAYIKNAEGCERASEPITITVKKNPLPIIVASSSTTFCEGQSVNLYVPNNAGYKYEWSNGATTPLITVTESGDYFVKVTNAAGCERTSVNTKVTVFAIPKPTIQVVGSTDFCEPETVTLTIKETGDSYRWSTGATTKSIVVNTSITVTAYIKNAEGCERASEPITINVKANPLPLITQSASTTFCEGESVKLSVPNLSGYKYEWSTGATTPAITVTESGDYFVKVTNTAGCERISQITKVTVHPIPKPTILVVGSTNFCEPETVTLTINETAFAYRWSNGATTKSITLSASETVTAYIKNAEGCERASEPITINVKANPLPIIVASSSTTFCEGENIKLSVTNVAGYKYEWSNGATTPVITVTESGDYFVKVTNTAGCERISEITKVTVHPIPKPTILVVGSTNFCEPETVTLTINETAFAYRWSNGATTKSITLSNSATVTAYIKNAEGCERASEPITITVKPNPVPVIQVSGSTTFCDLDSRTLSVPLVVGEVYNWSTGETGNSIVVTKGGSYYVTVTSPNGCIRSSEVLLIKVLPNPKPVITLDKSATICEDDFVTLTSSPATSYFWPGTGFTTQSIRVAKTGTYHVETLNEFGCANVSEPVTITVNKKDKPIIIASDLTTFCQGGSVVLRANPGMKNYLWSTGEITETITVSKTGDYSVIITNPLGCSSESEITKVKVLDKPKPTITPQSALEFCQGGSVLLKASEGKYFLWSNGELTDQIRITKTSTLTVTITNELGCSETSAPITVTVNEPTPLTKIEDFQTCVNGGIVTLNKENPTGGKYAGKAITDNKFNPLVAGVGFHKITYTYINNFGCTSQLEFTIEVTPLTPIIPGADIAVCEKDTPFALAISTVPSGTTFSGNGVENGLFNPTLAGLGKHTISYRYANEFGCISNATRVIEVVATPSKPIVTGITAACNLAYINLRATSTATGNPAITYLWYKEGASTPFFTGQAITYQVNGSENIYVEARAANKASCTGERTEVKVISYNPTGDFYARNVTALQGSVVEFVSEVANGVTYQWNFGDGLKSTEANPRHYYNAPGIYKVSLTAISSQGCYLVIEKDKYITILKDGIISVPPDNSNNPILEPKGYKNTLIYPNPIKNGNYTMRVFNDKKTNTNAVLEIYSLDSRLLKKTTFGVVPGANEIQLNDVSDFAKTYYLFVIIINNKSQTFKVLIL